jgi:hypothetical protein
MADNKTILDRALEYDRLGWSIIPIRAGTKKPAIRSWKKYQTERPDKQQLRKWFGNNNRNIAVVLGEVSNGLACRDFDTMAEYEKWAKAYPDLAKILPTVQTANGMHVYFEGHIKGIKHISNGELRGKGGYCLLPPSVHPDGTVYQWANPIINGNLLAVDLELAGFLPDVTENTEQSEKTEQSEAIVSDDLIERAIKETLPKENGARNRKIFEFARAIKTLPQFTEADPKKFREIVEAWHKRALPNIRTKEFEETWIDFLKAWPRIKYLKGQEPIMNVFEKAKKRKPPQIAIKLYPDNGKLKVLASLCRELQAEAKENPFYLSVRTAGRLLDVSPMHASRWLFLMVSDGILRIVEKGGTAKAVRKATRFRYIAN